MGRPPCCDKMEVKKGPWTPEEDIMLVSYVQQHGPGNWRQVPTSTGLHRCSKSCRLRWTNYLRPDIKRGDFTGDEEKMIIQLQALLGNKWAAIASYLPKRTDNDIKNYWNTHLKKKLKKLQTSSSCSSQHDHLIPNIKDGFSSSTSSSSSISRGQWEKKLQTDIHMAKQALNDALSIPQIEKPSTQTATYPSSTENIAKLLKGFMKNSPKTPKTSPNSSVSNSNSCDHEVNLESKTSTGIDLSEAFESLFGFDQSFESPNDSDFSRSNTSPEGSISKPDIIDEEMSLTLFENWLFDEVDGEGMDDEEEKADLTNFSFDENPNFFNN